MSSIKIAHIATIDASLRTLLLNQMRSIQELGYEVVGISNPGPYVPDITAAGVRHIAVPMSRRITPIRDLYTVWRLYRTLSAEKVTIVHTHTVKPILLGQLAARLAGVPIVLSTIHGFYFHDGMPPLKRRFFIALEKFAAHFADVLLSQNGEDVLTARREGICPPEKIKHLGNGIRISEFTRERLDPEVVAARRRELGLLRGPVVGFVGRLVAEKGILELMEAARTVLNELPSAQFLIVGLVDREKADAVTPDVAERYGIAERCIFAGERKDMPEMYAQMDVLVLPSHREGFPRVAMEASAMTVPCVVSDIRGCRETVEDGRNGLLVPPGDASALAQAVLRILKDRALSRRMGEEGRRIAVERFDEACVIETVTTEYLRLLRERGLSFENDGLESSLGSVRAQSPSIHGG